MRKNTILVLLLGITLSASAQFTITGNIRNLPEGKIYLENHGRNIDSTKVVGGKFKLSSKMPEKGSHYVSISMPEQRWGGQLWIMDGDHASIEGTREQSEILGSKIQDEFMDYYNTMIPYWEETRAVLESCGDDASRYDSISALVNNVYKPRNDSVFMDWARKHPSSYITLNHIYNWRQIDKYPFKVYAEAAKVFTPGAFEGEQWETFQRFYQADLALQPGHPFPALTMPDVYGNDFDVASLKGKYVLVTVSSFGVNNYDNDLILRRELYEKYNSKGLDMVDYLLTNDLINVIKAPANYNLRWHFVSDLKGWLSPWLDDKCIDHITQNFLIDRNGMIIGRDLFGDELKKYIDKLFY